MPARRAAASALSRTDESMPSTLHDTREFMLLSGYDLKVLHLAPSASPRIPKKRQSNSARAVCLWVRLFRVTVKNGLRNRFARLESFRPTEWTGRWGSLVVVTAGVDRCLDRCLDRRLGFSGPSKVYFGTMSLLRCKKLS
jgi:hypothetical protein